MFHCTARVLEVSEEESSIVHRLCIVGNIGGLINPQKFHISLQSFKKSESFLCRTAQVSPFLKWEQQMLSGFSIVLTVLGI